MSYFSKILIGSAALVLAASNASADDKPLGNQMFVDFVYNKTAPIEKTYANFQSTARKACISEVRGSVIYSFHQQKKYLKECQNDLMSKTIAATKNDALIELHAKATHLNDLIKTAENKK